MIALARYFDETNDTPSAMSERLKCAPSTITRIVSGERRPSVDLAKRIAEETGGRVPAGALLGLEISAPAALLAPEPVP